MDAPRLCEVERALLLAGIQQVHGFDFSGYAEASLHRRLQHWLAGSHFKSFGEALPVLLRDRGACRRLVDAITVNVTQMFRDPGFFLDFRRVAVPYLRRFARPCVWVAGCASGEEVYSLAIVLHEEGLLPACRIYATDLSTASLARVRQCILPLSAMQELTRSYQLAGGSASLADYYVARYGHALIDPALVRGVVFAPHNLATDAEFNEMQAILCRNVLIYFKPALRERVLGTFDACLSAGGFLGLGMKENLRGAALAPHYEEAAACRLYRKRHDHRIEEPAR